MERFLTHHQKPKPDPGIVGRAVKAKQHRRLEKIIDSTLHKRKKLEIRSEFLRGNRTGEMPYMISRPGPLTAYNNVTDNQGRTSGRNAAGHLRPANSTIKETFPGEQSYALHSSAVTARPAMGGAPARVAEPAMTTFHKHTPRPGNSAQWEQVAAGLHLADSQSLRFLEHPRQPLAPGLMARRMLNLEGRV